jgi:hypothetical protein
MPSSVTITNSDPNNRPIVVMAQQLDHEGESIAARVVVACLGQGEEAVLMVSPLRPLVVYTDIIFRGDGEDDICHSVTINTGIHNDNPIILLAQKLDFEGKSVGDPVMVAVLDDDLKYSALVFRRKFIIITEGKCTARVLQRAN